MRLAHFHTNTILASWTNLAISPTLRQMGYEVLDAPILTDRDGVVIHTLNPRETKYVATKMPKLEELRSCDMILVTAPEYIMKWLNTLYGKERWCSLKAPRVAFYMESSQREDCKFDYERLQEWFSVHFYLSPEDAKRFKGHHNLVSVDTEMFKPSAQAEKKYDAAFLGTIYPKRVEFLNQLLSLMQDVDFYAGGVAVKDLGGERHREWAELMVENLRQIKVHVSLPSNNSKIMIFRPLETMAAGTFLLTPYTEDNPFRDGEHCRFYDPENPKELAQMIRYYLNHEKERETIALAGCQEVHRHHSLKQRLENNLAIIKSHYAMA